MDAPALVEIDSIPSIADARILEALAARGVEGSVTSEAPLQLSVETSDRDSLIERIQVALDQLVLDHAPSLIPERVGPLAFIIHPPAA
jgi:hypothetical protein